MSVIGRPLERLRQPEYTGENRCTPCTVVNLAIAVAAALAFGVLWPPLGAAFLVVGVGSIWLRGYLVPKTPELTKRYFPEWLLAKFDKAPEPATDATAPEEFDPESVLLSAGVVEPCEDGEDLCLTAGFEAAWNDRMAALADESALRSALADQLDLGTDEVSVVAAGNAFVARSEGRQIGQWESRAALLADLAAARELPDRVDAWEALDPRARSQLLGGLRIFVEACPACGGRVEAGTEVVESCCRSTTVVAVACTACEARLLEVPYEEPAGSSPGAGTAVS